jgi:Ca2+-transporting ATPase
MLGNEATMTATSPETNEPGDGRGLSETLARARLRDEGANELPSPDVPTLWTGIGEVVREPMLLLLLSAGSIYLILGDRREALVLLLSVFVIIGITLFQNRRSQRALAALRDLASPRALVLREGRRRRIPGREVVREDILLFGEGDRIAADSLLLEAANLTTDESLLTGESVPVVKDASGAAEPCAPGETDRRRVYSGTLVTSGCGVARVEATGPRARVGRIGGSLGEISEGRTRLQAETDRLVRRIALLGGALCALVAVLYGLTRASWLDGMLAGLALAMAVLPEEFPVVLTVFLAIGAWRISRRNVLTRHLPAIESLGAATVLCVDKTGTLTQNRMTVRKLRAAGETIDLQASSEVPERFHDLLETGVLACPPDPFDPMERAIRELGQTLPRARSGDGAELVANFPLSRARLATIFHWRPRGTASDIVAAKGAPEAIADLCRRGGQDAILLPARALAAEGLRVLAVARVLRPRGEPPVDPATLAFEPVGLIALEDPVRAGVGRSIRECHEAGIRVVMITGDHPATAQGIARQIGLARSGRLDVATGTEIAALDDPALLERVAATDVFARIAPEQKLRLVQAFQSLGQVVAMTGDGVNDAPALKAADMGIAMGERGTDVARESADLVLLDDDFSSIVEAVRLGRRIFDNLRKAVGYILAVHVPIAGISLLPVLLGWPLALLPLHIVFLELIIDPACSLVFEAEPEEPDVMRRPPRDPREPLVSRRMFVSALLQGGGVLAATAAVFGSALWLGRGEEAARTMAFTTLIAANLGLILANRSWSRTLLQSLRARNAALLWVFAGAVGLLVATLAVPGLREIFRFARLPAFEILLGFAAGAASATWRQVWNAVAAMRTRATLQ